MNLRLTGADGPGQYPVRGVVETRAHAGMRSTSCDGKKCFWIPKRHSEIHVVCFGRDSLFYAINRMFRVPQFITGRFVRRKVFLEDETYALALDALTKACSDVLVVSPDRKKVLLGLRQVHPQPDWWLIGGRSRPGQHPREAAADNVRRELGLGLPPSRFRVVGSYNLVWEHRQQRPQANGTADISTVHALVLTPEEFKKALKPDRKEYRAVEWTDIQAVLSGGDRYSPALQQFLRDLAALFAYEKLEKLVKQTGPPAKDSEVAAAARALFSAHGAVKQSTHVVFDQTAKRYLPATPKN